MNLQLPWWFAGWKGNYANPVDQIATVVVLLQEKTAQQLVVRLLCLLVRLHVKSGPRKSGLTSSLPHCRVVTRMTLQSSKNEQEIRYCCPAPRKGSTKADGEIIVSLLIGSSGVGRKSGLTSSLPHCCLNKNEQDRRTIFQNLVIYPTRHRPANWQHKR
jgi:hypothetical protein